MADPTMVSIPEKMLNDLLDSKAKLVEDLHAERAKRLNDAQLLEARSRGLMEDLRAALQLRDETFTYEDLDAVLAAFNAT